MIDEVSKTQSFTILSDYLIESKPGELINFDIITKMNNTNMSIEQIYNRVGYISRTTFIRAFTSVENITPSEYRKNVTG